MWCHPPNGSERDRGQVLAAVTLDHFGAFGLTPHPISTARLAGAVLLIAGVVLIRD